MISSFVLPNIADPDQAALRASQLRVFSICLNSRENRANSMVSEKITVSYEPLREKTGFLQYVKTKTQISFAVTAKLISAFVFATEILQSLYFLNPKFQASSHLQWLYSPVCVGPGRKP